jgi:hypothetical protein
VSGGDDPESEHRDELRPLEELELADLGALIEGTGRTTIVAIEMPTASRTRARPDSRGPAEPAREPFAIGV